MLRFRVGNCCGCNSDQCLHNGTYNDELAEELAGIDWRKDTSLPVLAGNEVSGFSRVHWVYQRRTPSITPQYLDQVVTSLRQQCQFNAACLLIFGVLYIGGEYKCQAHLYQIDNLTGRCPVPAGLGFITAVVKLIVFTGSSVPGKANLRTDLNRENCDYTFCTCLTSAGLPRKAATVIPYPTMVDYRTRDAELQKEFWQEYTPREGGQYYIVTGSREFGPETALLYGEENWSDIRTALAGCNLPSFYGVYRCGYPFLLPFPPAYNPLFSLETLEVYPPVTPDEGWEEISWSWEEYGRYKKDGTLHVFGWIHASGPPYQETADGNTLTAVWTNYSRNFGMHLLGDCAGDVFSSNLRFWLWDHTGIDPGLWSNYLYVFGGMTLNGLEVSPGFTLGVDLVFPAGSVHPEPAYIFTGSSRAYPTSKVRNSTHRVVRLAFGSSSSFIEYDQFPENLPVACQAGNTCRYATITDRPWLPNVECTIVECRAPSLPPFSDPVALHLRLTDNPEETEDYYEVRSNYCNRESCSLFTL